MSTGLRQRKAWHASSEHWDSHPDNIEFGPSAGKVRYQVWLSATECRDFPITDIRVRRAPERDVFLPQEHPIVQDLSKDEIHCLLHAYGGTGRRSGNRDYFYTHQGDLPLVRLVEMGLMTMHPTPSRFSGDHDMAYFILNWMGKQVCLSLQPTYPR